MAEKGLELKCCCTGEDHPEYQQLEQVITHLREEADHIDAFDSVVDEYCSRLL